MNYEIKSITLAQSIKNGTKLSPAMSRWVSSIRSQHAKGTLKPEVLMRVTGACMAHGVVFDWKKQKPGPKPDLERDQAIRQMRETGASLQAVGDSFGVSRQRIHQVLGTRA